jgi:hypothetical protein
MAAFEYRMVHVVAYPVEERLDDTNALGAEGWEAFAVSEDNTGWWVFLKRPAAGPAVRAARPRRRGQRRPAA